MGTQSDFLVGLVNSVGHVDFETVYQPELPRIYNFFRYRRGDDQLAEDLTAQTFEKAWKHRVTG
ncbi:MAG TPA: sigma factor [Anaerolineales bacterium]